jgi:hypothetical protein
MDRREGNECNGRTAAEPVECNSGETSAPPSRAPAELASADKQEQSPATSLTDRLRSLEADYRRSASAAYLGLADATLAQSEGIARR